MSAVASKSFDPSAQLPAKLTPSSFSAQLSSREGGAKPESGKDASKGEGGTTAGHHAVQGHDQRGGGGGGSGGRGQHDKGASRHAPDASHQDLRLEGPGVRVNPAMLRQDFTQVSNKAGMPLELTSKTDFDVQGKATAGQTDFRDARYETRGAYNYVSDSEKPGYTPQMEEMAKDYIVNNGLSRPDLLKDWSNIDKTTLVAHRGLVNYGAGIMSNSWGSIVNALSYGIRNVELDIQSTQDGVAVPIHDDMLTRELGLVQPVSHTKFLDIAGRPLMIERPRTDNSLSVSDRDFVKANDNLVSVETLLKQSFQRDPHMTFFLDCKHLDSAMAIGKVLLNHPEWAEHTILKVYHGSDWPADSAAQLFNELAGTTGGEQVSKINVMPVIFGPDLKGQYSSMANSDAVKMVTDTSLAWGKYFTVPQVELGGYEQPGWKQLRNFMDQKFKNATVKIPGTNYQEPISEQFFNNPYNTAEGRTYTPHITTGYRFEDFDKNGKAYDYTMDNTVKEDTHYSRRTVGAQSDAGGWIVTDLPLQEALAIKFKAAHVPFTFSPGNRYVDLDGSLHP